MAAANAHRFKRQRRGLSTEDDTDGSDAWMPTSQSKPSTSISTRPRRAAASGTSATIERTSPTSDNQRHSIKLTVKAPANKLRAATSTATRRPPIRRSRHPVIVSESEEDDEEDEIEVEAEDDESEQDQSDEDQDVEMDSEVEVADASPDASEEDEDMEDADAEGDEDDEAEAIEPRSTYNQNGTVAHGASGGASRTGKTLDTAHLRSKQHIDDDDDDDELSELESPVEDAEVEEDEDAEGEEESAEEEEDADAEIAEADAAEADAEGEDDEEEDAEGEEEDAEGEDDDEDSNGSRISGSRGDTPDLSKLTRRQRAAYEDYGGGLMALSNEAQKKKHLTAEEYAMRRAEMARRRKNLSEKRNEEEKMDTINRLLKKQAPKRRRKADDADMDEDGAEERPPSIFMRFIQTVEGSRLAIPEEWLEGPLGAQLQTTLPTPHITAPFRARMVEEID